MLGRQHRARVFAQTVPDGLRFFGPCRNRLRSGFQCRLGWSSSSLFAPIEAAESARADSLARSTIPATHQDSRHIYRLPLNRKSIVGRVVQHSPNANIVEFFFVVPGMARCHVMRPAKLAYAVQFFCVLIVGILSYRKRYQQKPSNRILKKSVLDFVDKIFHDMNGVDAAGLAPRSSIKLTGSGRALFYANAEPLS